MAEEAQAVAAAAEVQDVAVDDEAQEADSEAQDVAAEEEVQDLAEEDAHGEGAAAAVLGASSGVGGDGGGAALAAASGVGGVGGFGNGSMDAMMMLGMTIGDATGDRNAHLKQQESHLLVVRRSVHRKAKNEERKWKCLVGEARGLSCEDLQLVFCQRAVAVAKSKG